MEEIVFKYMPTRMQHALRDHKRFGKWVDWTMLALGGVGLAVSDLSQALQFFSTHNVELGVRYGSHPRQTLDIYKSISDPQASPTVVFVHGGAWGFGSSLLYRLHARKLQKQGLNVVVVNYRLYPYVSSESQAQDISLSLQWIRQNADRHACNPHRVFVLAHSSGAHVALMSALQVAFAGIETENEALIGIHTEEAPKALCEGMVLMSGVYDIVAHYEHEKKRNVHEISFMKPANWKKNASAGLDEDAWRAFQQRSPVHVLGQVEPELGKRIREKLPAFLVLHGEKDKTVPMDSSRKLQRALESIGAQSHLFEFSFHDHVDIHLGFIQQRGGEAVLGLILQFVKDPQAFKEIYKESHLQSHSRL